MAVLVNHQRNMESGLDEVVSFTVIPRNKRPSVLGDKQICLDTVPTGFFTEWYKYYVMDNVILINLQRKSIEAAKGV